MSGRRRRYSPAQRLAGAHHEAGHTVVAVDAGFRVLSVGICSHRMRREAVQFSAYCKADIEAQTPAEMEAVVRMAMAGGIAQHIHRPSSWRQSHGYDDSNIVERVMDRLGVDRTDDAWLERLSRETYESVLRLWPHVERIAERLVARSSLGEDDVLDAFHGRPLRPLDETDDVVLDFGHLPESR